MASSWRIHTCLFLLLWSSGASSQRDLTLKEGGRGAVVVRAVIEKISTYGLFSTCEWWDRTLASGRVTFKVFLRQAAFALTEDGTTAMRGQGGIWSISESVFNRTLDYLSGNPFIAEALPVNLMLNFSNYTSLDKPIYSGLAAVLCLHQRLVQPTLQSCMNPPMEQDYYNLWREVIGTSLSRLNWINQTSTLKLKEQCKVRSDVVFVLDSSISVTPDDYREAKRFVWQVTENLSEITRTSRPQTCTRNQVGVIIYGATARSPLNLTCITDDNKGEILLEIMNIKHLRGPTNTADGLCQLVNQPWRNNSAVIRLAIVLSDGMSNKDTANPDCTCRGDVKEVAECIHTNPAHIIITAIGIGTVNLTELSYIASKNYPISTLEQYNNLGLMTNELRYQICYTLSAGVRPHDLETGTVGESETMRYVLNNITQYGVSIRFCITSGAITFYVAQGVPASAAMYEMSSSITKTDTRLSIECETIFQNTFDVRRQKRQASQSIIYLSIEGHGDVNTFTLQSGHGNVSFDTNECGSNPSPCDKSATCHNTDGSFYCVCNLGYDGDGFKCTSYLFQLLVFLVPSVFMGVVLLCVCVLLIAVGICVCRQKSKSQKINKRRRDSKKSPDKKALSLSTSL